MKRILFSSTLLVLLIGITSLAPAAKFKYASTEGKVSATFPAEFSTSEDLQDTYKSVKTQAMDGDMVFFVAYTVHDIDMTEVDELTKVSVDAFVEGLQGEVTSQAAWKVNKSNGIQAKIEVKNQSLIGEYRVVIIGQIQYQITAIAPEDSWDSKKAGKFFKSFKVKK